MTEDQLTMLKVGDRVVYSDRLIPAEVVETREYGPCVIIRLAGRASNRCAYAADIWKPATVRTGRTFLRLKGTDRK